MKILIVNYEFPPLGGGAGNATRCTARELVRLGHEVVILTSAFKGLPRREEQFGFRIVRIPTFRKNKHKCTLFEMSIFAFSLITFGFWRILREKPDAVIIYNGIPCGHVGPPIKWFLRIPYIVSLRGGEVPGFDCGLSNTIHRIVRPVNWVVWKCAASVTANGPRLKKLAEAAIRDIAVKNVPNGVDTEFFRPISPTGRTDDELRLIFVGRIVYQKGLDRLQEALDLFTAERGGDARQLVLTIIGDGDQLPGFKRWAEEAKNRIRAEFTGWVNKDLLALRLREADVYVTASRDEGVSNSILEAMASGLAVVASNIEGHRDVISHGIDGLLCDTPAMMADALKQLEDPDELHRFQRAALDKARSMSWATTAQCLADLAACAALSSNASR
jgi:glycosyltransferase involved in cell wall biosynthesis